MTGDVFRFTDYQCLRNVADAWRFDPSWSYQFYDARSGDFNYFSCETPDTLISVLSVSVLIFKHQDLDEHECAGLDGFLARVKPGPSSRLRENGLLKRKHEGSIDTDGDACVGRKRQKTQNAAEIIDLTDI